MTEAEILWQEGFLTRLQSLEGDQDYQTEFLDPGQLRIAEEALRKYSHLGYTAYGGYGTARRVCLNIFPAQREGGLPPVTAVKIDLTAAGKGTRIAPDQVRGEILRLGILWEELGDLVSLSEKELVFFTLERAARAICRRFTAIGDTPVQCSEVEPAKLLLPAQRCRQVRGSVASLRLDAIISLGFGLSRSRAALVTKRGLVKVNWRAVASPATRLEEGDRILFAGRGELVVDAVTGKTRKGRRALTLTKFS